MPPPNAVAGSALCALRPGPVAYYQSLITSPCPGPAVQQPDPAPLQPPTGLTPSIGSLDLPPGVEVLIPGHPLTGRCAPRLHCSCALLHSAAMPCPSTLLPLRGCHPALSVQVTLPRSRLQRPWHPWCRCHQQWRQHKCRRHCPLALCTAAISSGTHQPAACASSHVG